MLLRSKKLPLIIALCAIVLASNAQDIDYTVIRDYGKKTNVLKPYLEKIKAREKELPLEKKGARDQFRETNKQVIEDFTNLDTSGQLMFTDKLTGYVRQLLEKVVQANPELQSQTYCFSIQRTTVPNAYNNGCGIIRMNLDFVARHPTEAQVVYVLCHELAHDRLNHVYDGMLTSAEIFNSWEYKKEMNKAKNATYQNYHKTNNVYRKYLARYMEHNRSHEREADSLGLLYYYKTGYKPEEAVVQVANLDSCDRPVCDGALDVEKIFNFPDYPFQKRWLEYDPTATQWEITDWWKIPDSLKTHPEAPQRAQALQRIIERSGMKNEGKVTSDEFAAFNKSALFEELEVMCQNDQLGEALYVALNLKKRFTDSRYLSCVIVRALHGIYRAQLDHRFSQVVDFPLMLYTPSYNRFLKFMHNLNSTAFSNFATGYFKANIPSANDPYSYYCSTLISCFGKKNTEVQPLIKDYETKHGKNDYYWLLKSAYPTKK